MWAGYRAVCSLWGALFLFVVSGLAADPVSSPATCAECHREMVLMSHPVGIVPPLSGRHLPLAADGTITCGTCHVDVDHFSTGSSPASQLGRSLCVTCHPNGAGRHENESTLVHMATVDSRGAISLVSHSRKCASCHDGSSAPDAHVRFVSTPRQQKGLMPILDGPNSHPVGVRYVDALTVRPRSYRVISDLPAELLFEDAAVGCGTCHDLYGSGEDLLQFSNRGSDLCLSCHAMTPTPPRPRGNITFAALQSYFLQNGD